MANAFHAAAALAAAAALCGCGNWDPDVIRNRGNLSAVEPGMSKDQVKAVMGEPVTGEVYSQPDIWFYYTDCKWSDGMINSDECTPVVFQNGVVAGRGWDYYKKNVKFKPWQPENSIKQIKFQD